MTSLLSLKTDRPEFDTRSELGATTLCSFLASDPNKRIPNWLLDRPFKRPPSALRIEMSREKKIAQDYQNTQRSSLLLFLFTSSNLSRIFFFKLFPINKRNRVSLCIPTDRIEIIERNLNPVFYKRANLEIE